MPLTVVFASGGFNKAEALAAALLSGTGNASFATRKPRAVPGRLRLMLFRCLRRVARSATFQTVS